MRLAVFGASGRTGRHLAERALDAGHDVSALVRDPSRLTLSHPRLRVLTGDVTADDDVARAVAGCDAVLSALGVANAAMPGTVLSDGVRAIVSAMRVAGVGRVLAVANSGILDDPAGGLVLDRPDFPEQYLPITREHERVWRVLRTGDRDWTLVCTPDLLAAEPTGSVRAVRERLPADGAAIAVADVAAFMVAQLGSAEFSRVRVGVAW